jgi:acetyltransferase-like isoleucine patch superfamily enzyme
MKKGELQRIRNLIKTFLKSGKESITIKYQDTYLNPTKYYHKSLLRNPIIFLWKWSIINICTILPASTFKNGLYRLLGMKIGKDVSISWGVLFDMGYPQLISIGDGSIIGTGVKILTHETTVKNIRIGRVKIGKETLIGVRATIRSGIKIGDGAVVGAMSFVNKNVKRMEFVGGVPAKKIKTLKHLI